MSLIHIRIKVPKKNEPFLKVWDLFLNIWGSAMYVFLFLLRRNTEKLEGKQQLDEARSNPTPRASSSSSNPHSSLL